MCVLELRNYTIQHCHNDMLKNEQSRQSMSFTTNYLILFTYG